MKKLILILMVLSLSTIAIAQEIDKKAKVEKSYYYTYSGGFHGNLFDSNLLGLTSADNFGLTASLGGKFTLANTGAEIDIIHGGTFSGDVQISGNIQVGDTSQIISYNRFTGETFDALIGGNQFESYITLEPAEYWAYSGNNFVLNVDVDWAGYNEMTNIKSVTQIALGEKIPADNAMIGNYSGIYNFSDSTSDGSIVGYQTIYISYDSGHVANVYGFRSLAPYLPEGTIGNYYHFYGDGDYPSYFGGDIEIVGMVKPTKYKGLFAILTTTHTLDADSCYGYTFYVGGAYTITLPAIAAGMSVTFITIGANAVVIEPGSGEQMYLDGTLLDADDSATNTSTAGDLITFTYYGAGDWYAASNGWTDDD